MDEFEDNIYIKSSDHVYRVDTFATEQEAKEWYNTQKIALQAEGYDVFEVSDPDEDWSLSPIAKIFSNTDYEMWEAVIEAEKIDRQEFPVPKVGKV